MLILWEHFKTKMKKIGLLERMLHCVKIDKFKKMTLYMYQFCRVRIKVSQGLVQSSTFKASKFVKDNFKVQSYKGSKFNYPVSRDTSCAPLSNIFT